MVPDSPVLELLRAVRDAAAGPTATTEPAIGNGIEGAGNLFDRQIREKNRIAQRVTRRRST
jgi:hypothetical protein